MDKFAIARVLDEIARYVELSEPNRFKSAAFERAARSVRSLDREPSELVASGEMTKTAGIGKATAAIIEELVRNGTSRYLDDLRAQYPPGIFELLRVPSLGLKKIGFLHETLGIGSLDELEAAAKEGRLAKLHGFGAKTQQKILENIEKARRRESQFLLPVGIEVAETLREQLATVDEIEDCEVSGSVRRRLEVIRNVNLVVVTRAREPVAEAIGQIVEDFTVVDEDTVKGIANGEIDVWFHFTTPSNFGATMLRTTGTREFVDAFPGTPRGKNEKDVFKNAGVPYVEPELRENADALKRKRRVKLVDVADLRGTFHVHTTFSDGRNTVFEMLDAARERGWEYLGLSDHSKAAFYANGLDETRLKEQWREIDKQRPRVAPLRVFRGTEADILPDGSIDYDAKTLDKFDFVVASVHSRFGMQKDEMTERILRALDDPHVTFLGHLTGRLLLSRDGYTMDFDRVFERAGERGVMIEINGNPHRLDIDWRLIRRALDRGVTFCINPDAHSTREYAALISGTWVARKGGLSAREIFNTREVAAVAEHFESRRQKSEGRSAGAPP